MRRAGVTAGSAGAADSGAGVASTTGSATCTRTIVGATPCAASEPIIHVELDFDTMPGLTIVNNPSGDCMRRRFSPSVKSRKGIQEEEDNQTNDQQRFENRFANQDMNQAHRRCFHFFS